MKLVKIHTVSKYSSYEKYQYFRTVHHFGITEVIPKFRGSANAIPQVAPINISKI